MKGGARRMSIGGEEEAGRGLEEILTKLEDRGESSWDAGLAGLMPLPVCLTVQS